ncbi:Hypothetical predicted protein [Podarcis lilfordi]|uniref:Uncharacterized protein n=1 Tax=Podarcis lilfordi TaxID=74358 RepID=A0AA35K609_9SAUR|nr:Hypothetical predicted protein [Podarcis lilfordi]
MRIIKRSEVWYLLEDREWNTETGSREISKFWNRPLFNSLSTDIIQYCSH